MELESIENKAEWDEFLKRSEESTLLQSWNWGEFAKRRGREVFRLGERRNGSLVAGVQLIKVISRRGNYLEAHQGPVGEVFKSPFLASRRKQQHDFLYRLKAFAGDQRVDFLRVRLPQPFDSLAIQQWSDFGFVRAPMYFPAEYTLLLDLSPSEEELLAKMRKSTRYGVRRAQREGVQVQRFSKDLNPKDLENELGQFFRLYRQTFKRQGFVPYGYDYFKNEVAAFVADDQVEVFLAKWQGQTVAAAIVLYFGDYAYYRHAASLRVTPEIFAPHVVMWEIIKSARRRGKKYLDFWGVVPSTDLSGKEYEYSKKHPHAGLTLFKRGFGGRYLRYMPTLDLPLSPKYWLTYAFVRYERWRRGL